MKRTQKGFTVIEGFLILLILAIIGGTGWYVWHSKQQTDKTLSAAQSESTSPVTTKKSVTSPKNIADGWKLFQSDGDTYSLRIPDGWQLSYETDSATLFSGSSANLTYKAGIPASITNVTGGRDGVTGFFVAYDTTANRTFENRTNLGAVKAMSVNGTEYKYEYTSDSEGIGPPKGTIEYEYYFTSSGKGLYVDYQILPGDTDQTSYVKDAISTLQFK